MPTITYSDLLTRMNKTAPTDLTEAEAESLINAAIDDLNGYGADINRMSGAAGTRTVSLDDDEVGPVLSLAIDHYYHDFSDRLTTAIGGVSSGGTAIDPEAFERKKMQLARRLAKVGGSRA